MEKQIEQQFRCEYCQRDFRRETTLAVHMCEPKRRYQERNETGVQLGFAAFLKFYETAQGSSRLKTFDDFVASAYYRAFVKFGRYCQDIRAIAVPRFVDWLLRNNKKIDHWCRDSVYTEFLLSHTRQENVSDALTRAIEAAMSWEESTGNSARDYLRYGNANAICHAISTGRITAWVLYNCDSGNELLTRFNADQVAMIWGWIDADYWSQRFRDYPADASYAKEILRQAGW